VLARRRPGILIIVENLTVPLDRRVWQEACALRDAGYKVSVICPKGGIHTAAYELLDGIHVFRHPLPLEARGPLGYLAEYSTALFFEFVLSIKASFKVGFDAVQACNPPDLIFIVGAFWKYLFGKPFVFDHHDINPELYEAKFGRRGGFHRLLHVLERMTFRVADVAIATNETFRDIATGRGGMDEDRVFVVRSVPDTSRFRRVAPDPSLKKGRRHLAGFVGIMGAQDGVDLFVEAMNAIVHEHRRNDVQALIVGTGTELRHLQQLATSRGLDDYITFTGFQSGDALLTAMSTFDVGIIPDPKNVYNDKISMNKVLEYMTLGIPFVQFDLIEGRKMAADAALYAAGNCPRSLAERMLTLFDDPILRERTAAEGLTRAKSLLRWEDERQRLLAAFERALQASAQVHVSPVAQASREGAELDRVSPA
jgi:glycosyltransferase involved in cell wall biosynthesis